MIPAMIKIRKHRYPLHRSSRLATDKQKARVLMSLAMGLSITGACDHAGLSRRTHQRWCHEDDAYRAAVDEAMEAGIDALEDVAVKRARAKSDNLLMFLLRARRPAKFRERVELEQNGPLQVMVRHFTTPAPPMIDARASAPIPAPSGTQVGRGGKNGPQR